MTGIELLETALAGFPVGTPPDRLYRFYDEGAIAALRDGTLKISPPKDLNDPFEMWAGISEDGLHEEDVVRSLVAENGMFRRMMKVKRPDVLRNERAYRDWARRVVRATPNQWTGHLKSYVRGIAAGAGDLGIASFSSFTDDDLNGPLGIRHWAMYGDKHRGFAIEYNGKHQCFNAWAGSKWFFPVKYLDDRLQVSLKEFDEWSDSKMFQMFRRLSEVKCSLAWGNEKEWRLIHPIFRRVERAVTSRGEKFPFIRLWPSAQPSDTPQLPVDIIRRVIWGVNTPTHLKTEIQNAVKQPHLGKIEIWETNTCDKDFALRLKRIK